MDKKVLLHKSLFSAILPSKILLWEVFSPIFNNISEKNCLDKPVFNNANRLKGAPLGLRQFLARKSALKMIKIAFLKAFFALKIFFNFLF